MQKRSHFWILVLGISLLVGVIVAVDYWFGTDIVGATARLLVRFVAWIWQLLIEIARFVWRIAVEVALYGWRVAVFALERTLAMLPSLTTGRFTKVLWPVAMGAAAGMYFSRRSSGAAPSLWARVKSHLYAIAAEVRIWWIAQHFAIKSIIVALLIVVQVHLHWVILLFPVGFLIPYLVMGLTSLQRSVLGPIAEALYFSRLGYLHARLKERAMRFAVVRCVVETIRLFRLYFATGWRIWYYDSRFAYASWRPFWRTTLGRIHFAACTVPRGEWAKRRMHRQPLLGGKKCRLIT